MIEFSCPHCDRSIKVSDEYAGKRAKCKYCRQPVRIPHASAVSQAEATEASALDQLSSVVDEPNSLDELADAASSAAFSSSIKGFPVFFGNVRSARDISAQYVGKMQINGDEVFCLGSEVKNTRERRATFFSFFFLGGILGFILRPLFGSDVEDAKKNRARDRVRTRLGTGTGYYNEKSGSFYLPMADGRWLYMQLENVEADNKKVIKLLHEQMGDRLRPASERPWFQFKSEKHRKVFIAMMIILGVCVAVLLGICLVVAIMGGGKGGS